MFVVYIIMSCCDVCKIRGHSYVVIKLVNDDPYWMGFRPVRSDLNSALLLSNTFSCDSFLCRAVPILNTDCLYVASFSLQDTYVYPQISYAHSINMNIPGMYTCVLLEYQNVHSSIVQYKKENTEWNNLGSSWVW